MKKKELNLEVLKFDQETGGSLKLFHTTRIIAHPDPGSLFVLGPNRKGAEYLIFEVTVKEVIKVAFEICFIQ